MTAGKLIARLRGPDDINLKCLGAGLIVLGVYLFSKNLQDSELVRQFFENIRSLGWWAPVLYVVLYIVMSGVILPSAVFKERRRLILVPRDTPYNLIHLDNMRQITLAGGIICPASPSFYSKPRDFEALAATVVDRVLDLAGFELDSYRWGERG